MSLSAFNVRDRLRARRVPGTSRTWLDIARAAAAAEGVGLFAMLGRRRPIELVAARQRAWFELRETGATFPAIGAAWGRDHSTVLHGVRVWRRACGLVEAA